MIRKVNNEWKVKVTCCLKDKTFRGPNVEGAFSVANSCEDFPFKTNKEIRRE